MYSGTVTEDDLKPGGRSGPRKLKDIPAPIRDAVAELVFVSQLLRVQAVHDARRRGMTRLSAVNAWTAARCLKTADALRAYGHAQPITITGEVVAAAILAPVPSQCTGGGAAVAPNDALAAPADVADAEGGAE